MIRFLSIILFLLLYVMNENVHAQNVDVQNVDVHGEGSQLTLDEVEAITGGHNLSGYYERYNLLSEKYPSFASYYYDINNVRYQKGRHLLIGAAVLGGTTALFASIGLITMATAPKPSPDCDYLYDDCESDQMDAGYSMLTVSLYTGIVAGILGIFGMVKVLKYKPRLKALCPYVSLAPNKNGIAASAVICF